MKIVFLDADTVGEVPNINLLNRLGDEFITYEATSPSNLLERMQGADIVITNKVKIGREAILKNPTLKLICIAATGMDHIDLKTAKENEIQVKNVVGYSTSSVVQLTVALLLSLINQIGYYDSYVKSGQYSKGNSFTHLGKPFWEIKGKVVGIIGLGQIGNEAAKILATFGAKIIYFSTSGLNNSQSYEQVTLDELMRKSDIICVHAPLNERTKNLIAYRELSLLKPTSLIVNVGRGGIINEADLAKAIDANLLAGAAVDVFTTEPLLKDNPLMQVKNTEKLLMTPHIAWSSIEARTTMVAEVAKNIQEFLNRSK
ncbi:D-2-hydroxyacid dehydrogenase [Flavobacteriaceae bacterium F89]|uniref:D-2-hydroxyacid dehydrogenase n=1 Tax=Cerina litoralis TaxID=2874477 RepID=A0AAE3JUC2_9FLAO|nr:D-2-hydroxyacid dehydrogenase [Cerina litoralis]MCG2462257.1 D-2-hydroxyacid dehydrogenase [Cerina litoralis]